MRRRFVVVPRDSTNNPYRPSSGMCVKKRHGYRCSRGSDYKPVAVARYINLARKLCLSLSLSFSGRLLLHSFSLRFLLVCADYKKLVYASWLHAPAFISGHPFFLFFFFFFHSPRPEMFTKTKRMQLRLFLKRYLRSSGYFVTNE